MRRAKNQPPFAQSASLRVHSLVLLISSWALGCHSAPPHPPVFSDFQRAFQKGRDTPAGVKAQIEVFRAKMCTVIFLAGALSLWGCGKQTVSKSTPLPSFHITNDVVAGELRQIIQVTNGLSLYFTSSNLCVWFSPGSSIAVFYDPTTLAPLKTLLETPAILGDPAYNILDMNGDGVADLRWTKDHSRTEIFYKGEWYERRAGLTNVISVNGKEVVVRFHDGHWVARTNDIPAIEEPPSKDQLHKH